MRYFPKAGLLFLLYTPMCANACWDQAAQRYGVSAELLYAIARVESRLNPQAINLSHRRRTGSYDIGLMQINSSNLRTLSKYGIHERDLFDPCTNIHVGAWLLAERFLHHGTSWNGVGAYNAACTKLKGEACQQARARYAWLVFQQLVPQRSVQIPPKAIRQRVPNIPLETSASSARGAP